MNVFVGGIHGVGKSFLASRASPILNLLHTSASNLIKEERAQVTWTIDNRVSEIDVNQRALADAVRRHNSCGTRLMLDGHFVLLDAVGNLSPLPIAVFAALNLSSAIVVEADLQIIAERIEARRKMKASVEQLEGFLAAERANAILVCEALHIRLSVLHSPTVEEFLRAISPTSDGVSMCSDS